MFIRAKYDKNDVWLNTDYIVDVFEELNDLEGEVRFTCSSCRKYQLFGTDYCYNCGAKMVEPQESEDEE